MSFAHNWWPFPNSQVSTPWHSSDEQPPSQMSQNIYFYCQLAHGSPTAVIQGFSTVQQLYIRIADAFEIPLESVLYCTLNTHKLDMNSLLGQAICQEDFIFVHVAGQAKELDLKKSEEAIGLTITDNGNGIAFIKSIHPGSLAALHGALLPGDHIQKVNGYSMVGCRHFDIASKLRDISVGDTIHLRLISPMSTGFSAIGPARRDRKGNTPGRMGTLSSSTAGRKTLRFRADGKIILEDDNADEIEKKAIAKVDSMLDSYLGVSDPDLAKQFWEKAKMASNPADLSVLIEKDDSGLRELCCGSTTFVYDLWGIYTDSKRGNILPK